MQNILFIETSVRRSTSFSTKLSKEILAKLQTSQELKVKIRDLSQTIVPHLSEAQLKAFFTPPDFQDEQDKEALKLSEELIAELMESDIIIIGIPMFNLSIPSSLKAWIDHIVRAGKTFRFTENGPQGLVTNKKVYLAISSGGIYSSGPLMGYDFIENYMKVILGFIGIYEVSTFRVEGVAVPELSENALNVARAKVNESKI